MKREPVVAGQFYSGSKDSLLKEMKGLIGKGGATRTDAIGIVSPHAGYMYSGHVAGSVFSSITQKAAYIIMGPNHTGMGAPFGITTAESWKTPLGDVKVDGALAEGIKENCGLVEFDDISHASEHSIEVQLPFIQYMQKDFRFVPIVIASASVDIYRRIGKAIANSIKGLNMENDTMIVASSDMTHYESADSARKKDDAAIKAVLALDEDKLMNRISELDITMCGCAPTAIMLAAAKELGANTARLVEYANSGDATGDYSSVVGYAGIVVYKNNSGKGA
ncbi:MAG: AmmeMemoRadiSam system protein B [Candidatus Omnitrophota bacterium]|nr:AmmeMemoRadiSam system protein B [Candidatus Omnitrophota bacterium]